MANKTSREMGFEFGWTAVWKNGQQTRIDQWDDRSQHPLTEAGTRADKTPGFHRLEFFGPAGRRIPKPSGWRVLKQGHVTHVLPPGSRLV